MKFLFNINIFALLIISLPNLRKMEWISSNDAIKTAINAVKEDGVADCCPLKKYLDNESLIHAIFIKHLDDAEKSYYIIYWLVNDKILCIGEVLAEDGTLLSFTPFTHPGTEHYHNFMNDEEMIRTRFHEDEFTESELVWKPCSESTSSIISRAGLFLVSSVFGL